MSIHRISVTADDIRLGVPRDPCNCPIGIAVRRALGDDLRVGTTAVWHRDFPALAPDLGRLPPIARQFALAVDQHGAKGEAAPFTFKMVIKHRVLAACRAKSAIDRLRVAEAFGDRSPGRNP